jgi:hypothetical protein
MIVCSTVLTSQLMLMMTFKAQMLSKLHLKQWREEAEILARQQREAQATMVADLKKENSEIKKRLNALAMTKGMKFDE